MELYDYQKKAITFALTKKASFMMIDLGLGKTAIALKAIQAVGLPAIVMAPVKVCYNTWPEEIAIWTPTLTYTIFHGNKKDKLLNLKRNIYLLPYSSLKWFYTRCCEHKFELRKFFMVYDESTFIKNWTTDRWKKYVKRMLPISSKYRMCLSATPVPNGLIDLWTQFYVLDHGRSLGHFPTKYRDRFFTYSGPPRFQTKIQPFAKEEIYKLIGPITKRLARNDYLKLPPIVYNKIKVVTPKPLKTLYNKLKKNSTIALEDGTATAFNDVTKGNKLRQFAQGAMYLDLERDDERRGSLNHPYEIIHKLKAEALKELVEGLNGQPVLIPIQFRFDYTIICDVFRKRLPVIRGGTSEKESQILIRRWNGGGIPILLCNPQSIGHGLNLQRGGHNIVWYALSWNLDHFHQLNGRLDRTGQKHGVVVSVLLLDIGIEERVFGVLRSKNSTQRDLLEAVNK